MIFNAATASGGGGSSVNPFSPKSDSKNHLWFDIFDPNDTTIKIYIAGTVSVDWGDGTTTTSTVGTNTHTYSETGIYDVAISGTVGAWSNTAYLPYGYRGKLISAELVSAPGGSGGLSEAYDLQYAYIADGVNISSSYAYMMFTNSYGLRYCHLGNTQTIIGDNMFQYCYSLSNITIPATVTSIGQNAFGTCRSLKSMTIPSSVTSIGNNAFRYCTSLLEYHVKPTTPPTLGTNAFYTNAALKIYVPSASLSTYQGATNWSTYASYMVGE